MTDHSHHSSHEELNISPPKNDFEGIRSHNPTKPLHALLTVLKQHAFTREIASQTGSSSHEELYWPGTIWRNHTTATPTYRGVTLLQCFFISNV